MARDLEPFAQDCNDTGPPFIWDEDRRFLIRAKLDAALFHLYLPCGSGSSAMIGRHLVMVTDRRAFEQGVQNIFRDDYVSLGKDRRFGSLGTTAGSFRITQPFGCVNHGAPVHAGQVEGVQPVLEQILDLIRFGRTIANDIVKPSKQRRVKKVAVIGGRNDQTIRIISLKELEE